MSGLLLGEVVATVERPHELSLPHPEKVWWKDFVSVYRELYPATREQMHRLAGSQRGGVDVVV